MVAAAVRAILTAIIMRFVGRGSTSTRTVAAIDIVVVVVAVDVVVVGGGDGSGVVAAAVAVIGGVFVAPGGQALLEGKGRLSYHHEKHAEVGQDKHLGENSLAFALFVGCVHLLRDE